MPQIETIYTRQPNKHIKKIKLFRINCSGELLLWLLWAGVFGPGTFFGVVVDTNLQHNILDFFQCQNWL